MLNSDINMILPPRFSHVDFKTTDERVQAVIKNIRKERKGIYLYGDCGTGKTHTAYAILKECSKKMIKARLYNSTEILDKLKQDFSENTQRHFNSLNEYAGLLIIDDIGAEKATDWVLETYYKIINNRYEKQYPTVFTTNLSLDDLVEIYGDRIPSRIGEMCKVIELKGEDRRILNKPYKDD